MTSILDAPEMELELPPVPGFDVEGHEWDLHKRIIFAGLKFDRLDDGTLIVIGPPHLVLRLIPGLYEAELVKKQQADWHRAMERRQFIMNAMQNVANDPNSLAYRGLMQQQMGSQMMMNQLQGWTQDHSILGSLLGRSGL